MAKEIVRLTSHFTWSHVKSENNPANQSSQRCDPSHLVHSSLWWHGSLFLPDSIEFWTSYDSFPDSPTTLPELKELQTKVLAVQVEPNYMYHIISKYAQFHKMWKIFTRHPSAQKIKLDLVPSPKNVKSGTLLAVRVTHWIFFNNKTKTWYVLTDSLFPLSVFFSIVLFFDRLTVDGPLYVSFLVKLLFLFSFSTIAAVFLSHLRRVRFFLYLRFLF